jgi:hypothetical protein
MSEDKKDIVTTFDLKQLPIMRSFKIAPDGNVEMTETQITTLKMSYREFLTFYRQNESALEEIRVQLSEDTKKKYENDEVFLLQQIEELKPIMKESELKTQENYQRMKRAGTIIRIKEELAKSKTERNIEYLSAVIDNVPELDKDIVMHELTDAEKHELGKIMLKVKQNQRKKK